MTGIANQSRKPAAAHAELGQTLSWRKLEKHPPWPSFPEEFGAWEAMVLRWARHNKTRAGLQLKGPALTSAGLGWRGNLLESSLHSPKRLWQHSTAGSGQKRSPSTKSPTRLESNVVLGKRFRAACRRMQCLVLSLFGNYRIIPMKPFSLNKSPKRQQIPGQ